MSRPVRPVRPEDIPSAPHLPISPRQAATLVDMGYPHDSLPRIGEMTQGQASELIERYRTTGRWE
jgi:hypothetical protein